MVEFGVYYSMLKGIKRFIPGWARRDSVPKEKAVKPKRGKRSVEKIAKRSIPYKREQEIATPLKKRSVLKGPMELYRKRVGLMMWRPWLTWNTAVCLEIAKKLFSEEGKIDLEALQEIIAELMNDPHFNDPEVGVHRKDLLRLLEFIENDRNGIRTILESVKKPKGLACIGKDGKPTYKSHAAQIVRATLGLPRKTELTAQHAQQAVLCALLSRVRQLDVGTCFAISIVILLQKDFPEVLARELKHLVEEDVIPIKENLPVFINVSRPKDPLKCRLQINISGTGAKTTSQLSYKNLSEYPSLCSALMALGIPKERYQEVLSDAIKHLRSKTGHTLRSTLERIEDIGSMSEEDQKARYEDVVRDLIARGQGTERDNLVNAMIEWELGTEIGDILKAVIEIEFPKKSAAAQQRWFGKTTVGLLAPTNNSLMRTFEFTLASFESARGLQEGRPHDLMRHIRGKLRNMVRPSEKELNDELFKICYKNVSILPNLLNKKVSRLAILLNMFLINKAKGEAHFLSDPKFFDHFLHEGIMAYYDSATDQHYLGYRNLEGKFTRLDKVKYDEIILDFLREKLTEIKSTYTGTDDQKFIEAMIRFSKTLDLKDENIKVEDFISKPIKGGKARLILDNFLSPSSYGVINKSFKDDEALIKFFFKTITKLKEKKGVHFTFAYTGHSFSSNLGIDREHNSMSKAKSFKTWLEHKKKTRDPILLGDLNSDHQGKNLCLGLTFDPKAKKWVRNIYVFDGESFKLASSLNDDFNVFEINWMESKGTQRRDVIYKSWTRNKKVNFFPLTPEQLGVISSHEYSDAILECLASPP